MEDPSSQVSVAELWAHFRSHFGTDTKQHNIGSLVRNVFPTVALKNIREKDKWAKRISYFVGLNSRVLPVDNRVITLEDVCQLLPPGFFIINLSADKHLLTIGKFASLICNGNKSILETAISHTGKLDVYFGGKKIDSGLGFSIELDEHSVSVAFSVLNNLRYCIGVPFHAIQHGIMKENYLPYRNDKQEDWVFSNDCLKVLNYSARKSTKACYMCRKSMSNESSEAEEILEKVDNADDGGDNMANGNQFQEHNDIYKDITTEVRELLGEKAPHLTEHQMNLICSQITNKKGSSGIRWDSTVIQTALSIWTKNPAVYRYLTDSGTLVLPSEKTLSTYKNAVQQKAGICEDMLKWMHMQARHEGLPTHGYSGGLILDEMAIQEDVQLSCKNRKKLIGFVNVGEEAGTFASSKKPQLANHVCQFLFHGITGFRFLVAHYPTNQLNGPQIYSIFWDVVGALSRWGFKVLYTCLDGASNNRSFIKLHLESSSDMAVANPFDSKFPVIFLSDPSHLIKKIRNNIMKSGSQTWHTRLLVHQSDHITWKIFLQAYEWDKNHGLSIHEKLTEQHLHPNNAEKMRNHLAEDVLDENMLHLMQRYSTATSNEAMCKGVISLLQQTSKLIKFFRDQRQIFDVADDRLLTLKEILGWFQSWEKSESANHLMSAETREDLNYLLSGFPQLVKSVTQGLKTALTPMYINSDILENIFCQQRGLHHGAGNNPNYKQYCYAINSITLGQKVTSKKGNAARRKSSHGKGSVPFHHLCKQMRL